MREIRDFSETGSLNEICPDLLLELLIFPNKFCCERLKDACDRKLSCFVTSREEAVDLMEYALAENSNVLAASCLQVFLHDLPNCLSDDRERALYCEGEKKCDNLEKAAELDPTLNYLYMYRVVCLMRKQSVEAALAEINRVLGFKLALECLELRFYFYLLEGYRATLCDVQAILTLSPEYRMFEGRVAATQLCTLVREHVDNWTAADCTYYRIEDTDLERFTKESKNAVLQHLSWLGLDWDWDEDLDNDSFAGALFLFAPICHGTVEEILDAIFSSLGYRSPTQLIEVLATIWEKTAARIFRNQGMHKYSLGWKLLNDLKVGIQRHFMEADNTNTIAFLQKVGIE
ncbi:hypothetical protein IFM89_033514, partial [Coptis chinensis]